MLKRFLDLFVRGLIVLIFISGSAVVSYFITRVLAYFIPYPALSGIFLGSATVVLTAFIMLGIAYFYVYHGFGTQADIIRKNPFAGARVVLTFDDGPSEIYTPLVLKILAEKKASATFFMVGSQVEKYPEVARRVVEEGHEVGNHTHGHITVPNTPAHQLASQVMRTNLSIFQHTGRYPHYLRPPRGLYDMRLRRLAGLMGQELVLWSLSSQDWHPRAKGEVIARRLIENVSSGDIILFHDGGSILKSEGSNRFPTVEALSLLIDGIRERGFEIISLEQYLKYKAKRTG